MAKRIGIPVRAMWFLLVAGMMAGCATTSTAPGSELWHTDRMLEIEEAYANGEITREAYLTLKNQADATRVEYLQRLDRRHSPSYYGPHFAPYYRPHFHPRPYR
jgi:hypothetical protein